MSSKQEDIPFDEEYSPGVRKAKMKRKSYHSERETKAARIAPIQKPWYVGKEKLDLWYTWKSKVYDLDENMFTS